MCNTLKIVLIAFFTAVNVFTAEKKEYYFITFNLDSEHYIFEEKVLTVGKINTFKEAYIACTEKHTYLMAQYYVNVKNQGCKLLYMYAKHDKKDNLIGEPSYNDKSENLDLIRDLYLAQKRKVNWKFYKPSMFHFESPFTLTY